MKITYLHQYFNTPMMPGGTRSFEMARRLVAAGHEVNLITSIREPRKQFERGRWYTTIEGGIRVHWFPVPYSNRMGFLGRVRAFFVFAIAAARRAAALEADVIFATSTPLTIVLPGIYASWRRTAPMVFEVRDMWPAVPVAMGILTSPVLVRAAHWLEALAYRCARHIVALAPGMRDDIIAHGVCPEKISVIPNGCDLDVFGQDLSAPAASLRRHIVWLGARPLILFAGTLGLANGVEYLVKIAASMIALDPEIRFVVIGDGAQRSLVQEAARECGVLDKNFFMLPAMQKSELAVWFAACDMTVGLFSGPRVLWKDAVQNKFFDALAAGKPIACNFRGFQSEVAVDHDVGMILNASDAAAAARDMRGRVRDVQWLASVKPRARALAEGEFSRDVLAGKLESVLLAAVSEA